MLIAIFACSPGTMDTLPSAEAEEPYVELQEQGIDRYLGAVAPSEDWIDDVGDINYAFDPADGPACMRGETFHTMVRDRGSEDLVIFLQGGGLCYSEQCIAISSAPPGIPMIDIARGDLEANPVKDWNVTYVPYCDGSLFGGDVDIDDDGDGKIDRHHRGVHNLSAALGVAQSNFPSPRRILLAGSSGGGYGTLPGAVLARLTWPGVPLYVFNDAGVGLGRDQEPDFIWKIIDEFQAEGFVPESSASILDQGHLTPLIGWQLQQDPLLKVAAYSADADYVISQIYLNVPGDDFSDWLDEQLGLVHDQHPERFQSFIIDGVSHTTLLGDPSGFMNGDEATMAIIASMLGGMEETSIDGVTIAAWMDEMLSDSPDWSSLKD